MTLDVNKMSYMREHRIGTRLATGSGAIYRYAKIDLGSLGKIAGKQIRHILYTWIPWNWAARYEQFRKGGE